MKRLVVSMVVAGFALVGSQVAAQGVVGSPVRFGVLGGLTVPTGDVSDFTKSGWHAGALVDVGLPLVPIGFRVDGTWTQFGKKSFEDVTTKARVIAGTANAVYTFNSMMMTKFYIIGGVGLYNVKFESHDDFLDVSASDSQTKFGLNGGLGVRFQLTGMSTFIEARYHDIFTSGDSKVHMIPISVGITF